MGTWDLEMVEEEETVKRRAVESRQTIYLADLLVICSEKHVELEPQYRSLKGGICYRGDQAHTKKGNLALYQTMSVSPASITAANVIIVYGLMKGHKIISADAVKVYLQNLLKSLAEIWSDFHVKFDRNHGLMGKNGHYINVQSLGCFAVYMAILRLELIGSES